jgi:hypothetical protein
MLSLTPSSLRPFASRGVDRIGRGAFLEAQMKRMIPIVDLKTGEVFLRSSDTSTLDVPGDFDREKGAVELVKSHAHYFSVGGKNVSASTFPRPLSWRVRGEECLVADAAKALSYNLSEVEPA